MREREGSKEISGKERWRRIGMSGSLRGKEVTKNDPVEYFFPMGLEVPLESQMV